MFKHLTIHLSEPICSCAEQTVSWNLVQVEDNQLTLQLWCQTCRTTLTVSPTEIRSYIAFDQPYPGKPKKKPDLKLLKLDPDPGSG